MGCECHFNNILNTNAWYLITTFTNSISIAYYILNLFICFNNYVVKLNENIINKCHYKHVRLYIIMMVLYGMTVL